MKYIFIDTETTGLEPERHSIHQLSIIYDNVATGDHRRFNVYIRPLEGRLIAEEALAIGNVTLDELKSYPPQEESFAKFKKFMDGIIDPFNSQDKALFLGYNVKFDRDFVKEWIKINESQGRSFGHWFFHHCIDIQPIARVALIPYMHLIPYDFQFKLVNVCRVLGILPEGEIHEAIEDTRMAREVYKRVFPNEFLI
jgi:DNA polymerase III epsilon subunit-like protein